MTVREMRDDRSGDVEGIAIVGMAGRFPGARDVASYWENLRSAVESISTFTEAELEEAGVSRALIEHPDYVPCGGLLQDHDQFDAPFFGFSPRDAALLDPQFRQFLECGWEALESAGYNPSGIDVPVGVYAGVGQNAYNLFNLYSNPDLVASVGEFHVRHVGNDKDFLATRLSYHLDLTGPSINVQTACSTSLVAVHLACQSLLGGECDMAVAGAVTVAIPQKKGALSQEGGIVSPDGHCRAFDAEAKGTVFGSGVALVVLKRLEDALSDGDTIHAVIRGSAVNNDGASKAGYMAPSVDAQAEVIAEALEFAGVDADTVRYVAAHGTGTPVGDPIEVAALTAAFRKTTDRRGFCALGSVKSNIGHLDTAAGVASLVAAVQAVKHGEIPPSLHFRSPNPLMGLEATPFYVGTQLTPWPSGGGEELPRRAGVSSLGVGGTNAHVVVEEAPAAAPPEPSRSSQLLVLSARTETSLDGITRALVEHLRTHAEQELADVAYTLQVGRKAFSERRVVVCSTREDGASTLEALDPERVRTRTVREEPRSVVFQFPGGGAQYPDMGRALYDTEPVFRGEVDRCLGLLRANEGLDLLDVLYPAPERRDQAAERIQAPSVALPLLFTIEYALSKLWSSWSVEPVAMIGHSMGEYTAACLAGVFPLEAALSLVVLRGRLFEELPEGGMTSVPLPVSEVEALCPEGLSFAAVNGPELCVVSGPVELLQRLESALTAGGHEFTRLKISVAAHSTMLDGILDRFREFLTTVSFSSPDIPFVSNVTGRWIRDSEATDPEYWVRHLRSTVQYSNGLSTVLEDADRILLEVGPGRVLTTLAGAHPRRGNHEALSSLRHPKENVCDQVFLLERLGQLWLAGATIDWGSVYSGERRRRVPLPTYRFDHQRYWIEPGDHILRRAGVSGSSSADDNKQWLYVPRWREKEAPARTPAVTAGDCVVFDSGSSLVARLTEKLTDAGWAVKIVRAGPAFAATGTDRFEVRIDDQESYEQLFRRLDEDGSRPRRIIHAWCLDDASPGADRLGALDLRIAKSFDSIFLLARALGESELLDESPHEDGLELVLLSNRAHQVLPDERPHAENALLLGPCRVIPSEIPGLRCRNIDVAAPLNGSWKEHGIVAQILAEIDQGAPPGCAVAYRGHRRWVQEFVPAADGAPAVELPRLRSGGVYLITGGLGGIGLSLAEHLASRFQAKLVLTSRTEAPKIEPCSGQPEPQDAAGPALRKTQGLRRIRERGGEVLALQADVTSVDDMLAVFSVAEERFGGIDGVFHAAGVIDDCLLQLKSLDEAHRVLAPKVRGTLVLEQVMRERQPGFLALFSSISALAGVAGQIDYSAANCFLDAFAQERGAADDGFTIAINWSAWSGVGMVAAGTSGEGTVRALSTHLLTRVIEREDERVYFGELDPARHWVLDEHRNDSGTAFLPGTAYLELTRFVGEDIFGTGRLEIHDVVFLAPLQCVDGDSVELEIHVRGTGDAAEVLFRGRPLDDHHTPRPWTEHCRAKLTRSTAAPAPLPVSREIDLKSLDRTGGEPIRIKQEDHLRFGPRWSVLREVALARGEGLAVIELPPGHSADLIDFKLHPAVLDMATAFALPLVDGYEDLPGFYVPLAYDHVRVMKALPARVISRIRCADPRQRDVAVFDIDICAPTGEVLVEIRGFAMVRVEQIASGPEESSRQPDRSVSALDGARSGRQEPGEALLESMIPPADGMEILEHVLSSAFGPQVVVCNRGNVESLLERLREESRAASDSSSTAEAPGAVSRANRSTRFVAPESRLQEQLIEIWSDMLGIGDIGIHDHFFELGGHSLLLTQIVKRIRTIARAEIPLRTLFEHLTISALSGAIEELRGGEGAGPERSIKKVSRESRRIKRSMLPAEGRAGRPAGTGGGEAHE